MTNKHPPLGRIPRPDGIPVICIEPRAPAVVLPKRPAEVRNIERDAADTGMYGNSEWGDCVFVMIEKVRVFIAEMLGIKITKLTAQQVIDNYKEFTGAAEPPGPGAVIVYALKWVQAHPEKWGGSKLLVYSDTPITRDAARNGVAEFGAIALGVRVYDAMRYGQKTWYVGTRGTLLGGHGVAGGSYSDPSNLDYAKTWGYEVAINGAGFDTVDEMLVLVWDFQWKALTYDRQVELKAAFEQYTGKAWTGPAPTGDNPVPMTVSPIGVVRVANDPAIRGLHIDGSTVAIPINTDLPVYQVGQITDPTTKQPAVAYRIADTPDGKTVWLLERNSSAYFAGASHAYALTRDGSTIFTF